MIRDLRVVPSLTQAGSYNIEVRYPAVNPRWEAVSSWGSLDAVTLAEKKFATLLKS